MNQLGVLRPRRSGIDAHPQTGKHARMRANELLAQAMEHHRAGRLQEAMQGYRRALELDPRQPDALNLLGLACHQSNHSELGAHYIAQAIGMNPHAPLYYIHMGMALRALGKPPLALAAYRQALALAPQHPDAWFNLGNLQKELGRLNDALASYEQSQKYGAGAPDLLNNMAVVLDALNRWEEAERCSRQALRAQPQFAEAHSHLGSLLAKQGRLEEALEHGLESTRLKPRDPANWVNLAITWQAMDQLGNSLGCLREAVRLAPRHATAHFQLGLALLKSGDYAAGWPEYEWRLQCNDPEAGRRQFQQPRWDGSPLDGRTILLHAEQGLGDTLQFSRFVPLVAARGGRVLLECPQPLARLLRHLPGVNQFIPLGELPPSFDCQAPLPSLPGLLGITLANLPPARLNRTESARQPLANPRSIRKIGLCWSANIHSKNLHSRILPVGRLIPLLARTPAEFFSFQIGAAAQDLQTLPPAMRPRDLSPQIHDFDDTARLALEMDLIVTIDTSMAHLAGLLGRPVWLLLSRDADWRWLCHRDDSPWYPTMRLFRQTRLGDWGEVIQRVQDALAAAATPG